MATTRPASGEVPPFLALAAHPVRWRMLVELAHSDRQVGELTRAVGRPQGLVSYHLSRLRAGGLVSARRSSFDGRAAYYRVHLDRCGELLSATGAALHPGLVADRVARAGSAERGAGHRTSVLFVCTGNGTRSQIAEALLHERAGDLVEVASAGSHPKPVHPGTTAVLAERGIDASAARSKPISELDGRSFDYVITLCDKVREICPEFPGRRRAIHWSIEDPSSAGASTSASMPAFREVADDLSSRIGFLIPLIEAESNKEHTRHGR